MRAIEGEKTVKEREDDGKAEREVCGEESVGIRGKGRREREIKINILPKKEEK